MSSRTAFPGHSVGERRRIAWHWWLLWMALLLIGLMFFYLILTPVWMGIRLVAMASERLQRHPRPDRASVEGAHDRTGR